MGTTARLPKFTFAPLGDAVLADQEMIRRLKEAEEAGALDLDPESDFADEPYDEADEDDTTSWETDAPLNEPEFITYKTAGGLLLFEPENPEALLDFTIFQMSPTNFTKALTDLIRIRWSYQIPQGLPTEQLLSYVFQFALAYPEGRFSIP